jgi:nitrate reductase NapE component
MLIWKKLPVLLRIAIVVPIAFVGGFCFVVLIPLIYYVLTHPTAHP